MEVVVAAAVPAILYYLCLFLQVDAIAARHGLVGLPRSELPRAADVLKRGWIFVVPLVVLIYLLFWLAFTPALSAMAATFVLFALMLLRNRRLPSKAEWTELVFGSGENMLPLILIGGAAGVVIGVMNVTGLGLFAGALAVGSSTTWLSSESPGNIETIAAGAVLYVLTGHNRTKLV